MLSSLVLSNVGSVVADYIHNVCKKKFSDLGSSGVFDSNPTVID